MKHPIQRMAGLFDPTESSKAITIESIAQCIHTNDKSMVRYDMHDRALNITSPDVLTIDVGEIEGELVGVDNIDITSPYVVLDASKVPEMNMGARIFINGSGSIDYNAMSSGFYIKNLDIAITNSLYIRYSSEIGYLPNVLPDHWPTMEDGIIISDSDITVDYISIDSKFGPLRCENTDIKYNKAYICYQLTAQEKSRKYLFSHVPDEKWYKRACKIAGLPYYPNNTNLSVFPYGATGAVRPLRYAAVPKAIATQGQH